MAGRIRFQIVGHAPFTANKGWMAQVPMQNRYATETVGDPPSLPYEVNISEAHTLYPEDEQPPNIPRIDFISVALHRVPALYDRYERARNGGGKYSGQRFAHDDRAVANVIYDDGNNGPPHNPRNSGYYHTKCAECRLIMARKSNIPSWIAHVFDAAAPHQACSG